jgi:Ca-activated chloride channel homolog
MNFINPLALLWLLLLAPVIIFFYLLKLKRREVLVSSVFLWSHLLKDVQANSPFQKLKRNLLLFLQLLAVLLLVLGLSRPLMRVNAIGGRNTILILDGSAGMKATDVGGSRFDEARGQALRFVDQMGGGDGAMVILAAARTRVLAPFTTNRNELRGALRDAEPTDTTTDLKDALALANSEAAVLFRGSQGRGQTPRIALFSDGAFGELPDVNVSAGELQFHQVGRRAGNVGLVALDVRKSFSNDYDYQCFASIKNFSDRRQKCNLELYRDDNLIDVREIDLAPGKEKAELFDKFGSMTGLLRAHLDLKDDLAADNEAYTLLAPRRSVSLLLVTSGNRFLERALNLDSRVQVSKIAPAAYTGQSGYDVVVFDDVSPKVVGPGNTFFIHAASPEAPAEVTGRLVRPNILDWDRRHPLMRFVSLSNVEVGETLTAKARSWGRPLAESESGPLLVAGERGGTRSIYLGFNPVVPSSNFCLKVAFPIFVSNCIAWLSERPGRGETLQVRAGEVAPIDVPTGVREVRVTDPTGRRISLPVEGGSEPGEPARARTVLFDQTERRGIYQVEVGKQRRLLAVNLLNRSESDTRPQSKLQWGRRTLASVGQGRATATREIWRTFALLALLLLVFEWYAYHRRL